MSGPQLSDQQLDFLRALWRLGEATGAQVQAELSRLGRDLAPTTVSTVLGRLEKRGLVSYRREGRQHVYWALVSETEVRSQVLTKVTNNLFAGDVPALVSQLLDVSRVSSEDLAEVQRLLAQHKTRSDDDA